MKHPNILTPSMKYVSEATLPTVHCKK